VSFVREESEKKEVRKEGIAAGELIKARWDDVERKVRR